MLPDVTLLCVKAATTFGTS